MKHLKHTLTILFGLLISIGLHAQEVTSSNLNIGSNNTIIENRGNVIGGYHIVKLVMK